MGILFSLASRNAPTPGGASGGQPARLRLFFDGELNLRAETNSRATLPYFWSFLQVPRFPPSRLPAVTVPSGRRLPGVRWFCSRQGGAWWGRQPWQGQRIAVPTRARLPTRRTGRPRRPGLSLSARSGRRPHGSTAFAVLYWFLAPDHGGVVIELRLDTRFRGWPRHAVTVRQNLIPQPPSSSTS